MHQQLTDHFVDVTDMVTDSPDIRTSFCDPCATVCPKLPTLPVSRFLRDLSLVDEAGCFFAEMGKLAQERANG